MAIKGKTEVTSLMPPALARIFHAAASAEAASRGDYRRIAFRNTRHLIAGAHQNGIRLVEIADVLQVSTQAIHGRNSGDGFIAATDFAQLAGVSLDAITAWQSSGMLAGGYADDGRIAFLASELVRALLGEQG
jgi:hypothetical protein